MGPVGRGAGQLEHLGAERGEERGRRLGRLGRHVGRGCHGLEVGAHGRQRLVVGQVAQALHQRRVGDPEAQDEAVARLLGDRALGLHHGPGVPVVDVGDARGEHERVGAVGQMGDVGERVPPQGLGQPQRAVAERFQSLRELDGLRVRPSSR